MQVARYQIKSAVCGTSLPARTGNCFVHSFTEREVLPGCSYTLEILVSSKTIIANFSIASIFKPFLCTSEADFNVIFKEPICFCTAN